MDMTSLEYRTSALAGAAEYLASRGKLAVAERCYLPKKSKGTSVTLEELRTDKNRSRIEQLAGRLLTPDVIARMWGLKNPDSAIRILRAYGTPYISAFNRAKAGKEAERREYAASHTAAECAEHWHISLINARKYCSEHDIQYLRDVQQVPSHNMLSSRLALCGDHPEKLTLDQIAAKWGVDRSTAAMYCNKWEIPHLDGRRKR